MLGLLARPTAILAVLLVLSSLGNVVLFKLRDRAIARVAAVTAERDQAVAQGLACSAGVRRVRDEYAAGLAKLRKEIAKRERASAAAVRAAYEEARRHERTAAATLLAQPSRPEDLCASALELSRAKLRARRP